MDQHASRLTVPVSPRDHILGPIDAPMELVEYGDYECPYCAAAFPVVIEVRRRLADSLLFAFRNFPIADVHPHSVQAAEAAEAAGGQGQFWPMHARLFAHQYALEDEALVRYAIDIGLDARRFVNDLVEHKYFDRIREDLASGVSSGVTGTPTFFVNGPQYTGARDVTSLVAALRRTSGIVSV